LAKTPSKVQNEGLILIDGSSYLYRAFYALPPLTNSRGEPTGAVFGVVNMIRKLMADYDSKYIAVIFDAKGKSFRHDIYSAYKANRKVTPHDLQIQIPLLFELIKAMGLPLVVIEGVEADDVIATLATGAQQENIDTLISTGDKDMAQLASEKIHLINTMSNELLDAKGVKEKFGVPPEKIIDYLALVGDTSDNIPGVPNVGPKTAAKWLTDYGSLEEIINHATEIKGAVGKNLRNSLHQLLISKQLVTLELNIKLEFNIKDLKKSAANKTKLIELLKRLEFKKWLAELLREQRSNNPTKKNYQTILTKEDFNPWLKKLTNAKQFAFDTETTSLDTLQAEIVGISFAVKSGEAVYIPVMHNYPGAPLQLSRDFVLEKLKPLLEDKNKIKFGQNLKYDTEVLANYNIDVQGIGFDTMMEAYILNSSNNHYDMESLALKYLGTSVTTFEEVAGTGKRQLTFNQIPIETAAPYAAEDADIVLQLHEKLLPELSAHDASLKILQTIEMPLIKVLARMERNGVCINTQFLQELGLKFSKRIIELEEYAYKLSGTVFNLASPKQLQEILFGKLKLPISKKTSNGQPSTAENVLQQLALDYPLPKTILEHRALSKLKSTYIDGLLAQIHPRTNRVHTSYNQAVTNTGRLSSTNPNLQNIPIRTEQGRCIRQAFIASPGYKIVSADYSQIELRIMAHLSQDKGLLKAFLDGNDIHTATAAEVFGMSLSEVTNAQRRRAKAINFGLIYGMSAFGLAQQLNISREQAQNYIDLYFARYPEVKTFMQITRDTAKQHGFVETLFGRRLYIPDINSSNFVRLNAAERAAINAPMQGSAADIIKIAMINIDKWIQKTKLNGKMIMQVHDELVFEIAKNDIKKSISYIQKHMTNAAKLSVPIVVNVGIGDNWDEAH
jgi:DNA polymerase-1